MPEVIHAHFWMSGLAALAAGRQTGVPVVQTYHALGVVKRRHQGVQDTSPARRIGYERELGRAVDRVIAQCRDEVGELVRMGVPRSRMTVVPSGVNLGTFAPLGPTAEREDGRPRILTVGRLVERKGFQTVVRAMAVRARRRVRGRRRPARRPAGDRPVRPPAARPRGQLRGRRPGPAGRRGAPRGDGPLVPLGGRPGGRPLVRAVRAHPAGGDGLRRAGGRHRRRRDPGHRGRRASPATWCRPGTRVRWAPRSRRLLDDRIRRFAYATAARERARRRYSWAATAERLVEVYGDVAAVRRPTRVVA